MASVESKGDSHRAELNDDRTASRGAAAVEAGPAVRPSTVGITLAGIKELKAQVLRYNSSHPECPIEKTRDIANTIVKPATSKLPQREQAYAYIDGGKYRGKPQCFVSHTWQADALGLLDAVIKHGDTVVARGGPPPVYYLDVTSVDQHQTDQASGNTAMPFDALSKDFVEQITGCGEVLVVASPFYDPIVVKRAWCLFEAVVATIHNVPTTVVSPPTEETELRDQINGEGGHDILINVMMTIDSSRAEATVAEDLRNIKKVIETDVKGAYLAVDSIYKTMIRRWVLSLLDTLFVGFDVGSADAARFANACGRIMGGVGEFDKAIEFYEKALAIDLRVYGDKHPVVATLYSNLGSVYHSQGSHDKATEFYENALAIDLKVHGDQHPQVAIYYNNLGIVYCSQGNYGKAIEVSEKALAIDLRVHGDQHPKVAILYNNLGLVYKSQGNYDKAIEFYEKALVIDLRVHGDKHPDVAIRYNNLGSVYKSQGDYDKAIEFYEKALVIDLKVHGDQHPDVATHYNNLGSVYDSRGNYDKAIHFYEKALAIDLVVHGDQHPKVGIRYNNLGLVHDSQGNYTKAIEFYEKALAIDLRAHGDNHPKVGMRYNNLGSVYNSQGNCGKAIEFYEKALAIDLKVRGEQHPDVAIRYNNLGSVYRSQGNHDKSIAFYEKAMSVLGAVLGTEHPKTKTVASNLASAKASLSTAAGMPS